MSFLELCRNIATADINLFSFFLKQGVDPNVFDEVCIVVMIVAVVRILLLVFTAQ